MSDVDISTRTLVLDQLRRVAEQLAVVPLSAWIDEQREAAERRCTTDGCEHGLCVLDDPDYLVALNIYSLDVEAKAALDKLVRAIGEAP